MDFAAQLENLERTAARAAASRNSDGGDRRRCRSPNNNCTDNRSGGGRNQRPRQQQQQQQQQRSALEAMKRFGYRVDPPAWMPKTERTAPHLCLLAITIDDLPYEHIWRAWASAATEISCYVSLVCHAKFPAKVTSDWLRQRLLLQPPRMGRGTTYDDPVPHTRKPEWGSVGIARAMTDCLQDAVQIGASDHDDPRFAAARFIMARPQRDSDSSDAAVPTVDKFVFVSETCLPVTTLKECVDALFFPSYSTTAEDYDDDKEATGDAKVAAAPNYTGSDGVPKKLTAGDDTSATSAVDPWDVSWVNARNRNTPGTPKNKYERDQFSDIQRMIPGMYRWKADQWLVLSRRHALAVLHIDGHMMKTPADQLWNAFAKINASDEMYFPTSLAILGILNEDDSSAAIDSSFKQHDNDTEKKPPTTFPVRLPRLPVVAKRAVTYTDWSEGMRNPASFSGGPRDLANVAPLARQQGCLFARKFAMQGPLEGAPVTGQITVDEWNEVIAALVGQEVKQFDSSSRAKAANA